MMAEDLPVKEIRCSLEVVAVLADHSPKIKLVTCAKVLKNNQVYMLYIEHARTFLTSPFPLFI